MIVQVGGRRELAWKATSHTLLTASPTNSKFFNVRKEVTYTPTSRNATPTRRSSESNARTKICIKPRGRHHQNLKRSAHLLSHGRNEVALEPADGSDRPLGIIPAEQSELVPSLGILRRIRYDFHNFENVRLDIGHYQFLAQFPD
jgi:hypothetical protein